MKMVRTEKTYSEMLHNSAVEWGLPEIPGRPIIGLAPSSKLDGIDGIVGNPYQEKVIPTKEAITYKNTLTSIRLFTFNGQWGYSMSADYNGGNGHFGYGSWLKFCEPFPTRKDALTDAVTRLIDRLDKEKDKHLIKWAKQALEPKQLSLL